MGSFIDGLLSRRDEDVAGKRAGDNGLLPEVTGLGQLLRGEREVELSLGNAEGSPFLLRRREVSEIARAFEVEVPGDERWR